MRRDRWVAPEHATSCCALALLQASRLFWIAPCAQIGLTFSAGRDVDTMRVATSVRSERTEHRAGMITDQFRLGALPGRCIVVRQRSPAGYGRRGRRHSIRRDAEPMREVRGRQSIIALIARRLEQAGRIHTLMCLGGFLLDQVVATQDLGDPQLGCLEVHALDMHYDVEDRVRALGAGAVRLGPALVPAPGWVPVRVIAIRATDVRRAVLPGDLERVEHLRLAAFDCRLKRLGREVALSHHPLARH